LAAQKSNPDDRAANAKTTAATKLSLKRVSTAICSGYVGVTAERVEREGTDRWPKTNRA
jgi:hypothetical protein